MPFTENKNAITTLLCWLNCQGTCSNNLYRFSCPRVDKKGFRVIGEKRSSKGWSLSQPLGDPSAAKVENTAFCEELLPFLPQHHKSWEKQEEDGITYDLDLGNEVPYHYRIVSTLTSLDRVVVWIMNAIWFFFLTPTSSSPCLSEDTFGCQVWTFLRLYFLQARSIFPHCTNRKWKQYCWKKSIKIPLISYIMCMYRMSLWAVNL